MPVSKFAYNSDCKVWNLLVYLNWSISPTVKSSTNQYWFYCIAVQVGVCHFVSVMAYDESKFQTSLLYKRADAFVIHLWENNACEENKWKKEINGVFRVCDLGFWSFPPSKFSLLQLRSLAGFWLHQFGMSVGNLLSFQEVIHMPDLWITWLVGELYSKIRLGSFVQSCGW